MGYFSKNLLKFDCMVSDKSRSLGKSPLDQSSKNFVNNLDKSESDK
jgi:hypothetical protein